MSSGLHWSREWYEAHHAKAGPHTIGVACEPGRFSLVLPWPPSVNHSHAGDHHLNPETRAYRRQVANLALVGRIKPLTGKSLALSVMAYPPDKRRRDLGNLEKQISDALQHAGLIADDFAFDRIVLARVWGDALHRGTVYVTVEDRA